MTHNKAGLKSSKDLDGTIICLQFGTDTKLNVADFLCANKNVQCTLVTFDRADESAKALESGRCDTLAIDQSALIRAASQDKQN